jgi:hypothetical protein
MMLSSSPLGVPVLAGRAEPTEPFIRLGTISRRCYPVTCLAEGTNRLRVAAGASAVIAADQPDDEICLERDSRQAHAKQVVGVAGNPEPLA